MAKKNNPDRGLLKPKTSSGRWGVEWYDHLGKKHRSRIGTKRDARLWREEVNALKTKIQRGLADPQEFYDRGFLKGRGRMRDLTLSQYFKDCIPELRTKKTWKTMKAYIKTWSRLIGDLQLDEVESKHAVLRRSARLERGVTPATCNRETEFLRSILNRAVRDGHLEENPLAKLSDLPEDNKRMRILTKSEELRLETEMTPENFEIIAVAVDTGLRRAKVFGLAWVDVDLENRLLTVREAKAGSSRQVPMTNRVFSILSRRRQEQRGAWVFPNSTGSGPINAQNFCRREFRPALERAQIDGLTFHDLRRTFGSRVAMAGKGGRVLSGLMGHRSAKTTDRYAHLDPETFQAAIRALDDHNEQRTGLRLVRSEGDSGSLKESKGVL